MPNTQSSKKSRRGLFLLFIVLVIAALILSWFYMQGAGEPAEEGVQPDPPAAEEGAHARPEEEPATPLRLAGAGLGERLDVS